MARGSIGPANGLGAVLPPLLMELVMISACRVERLEEFEQRVVRLQAEFAAGDAATRRRLLQPAHAKERFENYDPDALSLSDAGADIHIEGDIVLESAVSFDVIEAVAVLLDSGGAIDGVDGDGVPMAYAMH